MAEAEYKKPLPKLLKRNTPYFEGAQAGELRVQHCASCGHNFFPPSTRCPNCLSTDIGWQAVSGRGKVWSWIVMHQRYFAGFADELPYNVALIELEEGPKLMSHVVGVENSALRCEMPVEVVFERATDEISLPMFRPAGSGNTGGG